MYAPRGSTVSFRAVGNFDKLSEEAASKILYEELVPACEAKEVKLSSHGNHADPDGVSVEEYNLLKTNRSLFDTGSYGLKHVFERHPSQNEYLRNGDLIAAMLVDGHQARFGKRGEETSLNCEFKVKVKKGEDKW